MRYTFASDNTAGICPEALEALLKANVGHVPSYGNDEWTTRACDMIRELFEHECEVFFVFNGTAANSLCLASLCQSYHSVLCHELSHVETDECGAPEFFSNGSKLLTLAGANGKLTPDAVRTRATARSDLHFPKAKVVTVTQATELGTVYTPAEVGALGETAKSLGLRYHMDGARFSNALARLGCKPADITWRAGVEVLSLGGTKQGLPAGEAVVFFDKALAEDFQYRCKQAGQLASKMRYLAAPWVGMLEDGVWLKHAAHANAMASQLGAGFSQLPGVKLCAPVEANEVFAALPKETAARLREKGWAFYDFIAAGGQRFVCGWDTQPEDIEDLLAAAKG